MKQKRAKAPISHESIYRMMLIITLLVASVFLLVNVLGKNYQAAVVIGVCLAVFIVVMLGMKLKKVSAGKRELVLSVSLLLLDFIISLYSGESYSDDFPLMLTIIGMTGLYLEPRYTRIQLVMAPVLLVIMYVINPAKAGQAAQYILCTAVFILAGVLFYQTIKRGRAFIEMSEERAKEAEVLLDSIRIMGEALERDFEASSNQIENSTSELENGSVSIAQGAAEVSESCGEIHEKLGETEIQIHNLNVEVQKVEQVLNENQENIKAMNSQLHSVSDIVNDADAIFREMEAKMHEVTKIAEQINYIAFQMTMLSLNATIEAARAGNSGLGFEVVASSMRELSAGSNVLSDQVAEVAKDLAVEVERTSKQFKESTTAMQQSDSMMTELKESFARLTEQFASLYGNIEEQNRNVHRVDEIFITLNGQARDMQGYSADNQAAVKEIVKAMDIYKSNINEVIKQTQNV